MRMRQEGMAGASIVATTIDNSTRRMSCIGKSNISRVVVWCAAALPRFTIVEALYLRDPKCIRILRDDACTSKLFKGDSLENKYLLFLVADPFVRSHFRSMCLDHAMMGNSAARWIPKEFLPAEQHPIMPGMVASNEV
jgi:hypothetical protein